MGTTTATQLGERATGDHSAVLAEHTPGPWRQSHREGRDGMWSTEVYDSEGETIATLAWHCVRHRPGLLETDRQANAEFIVRACNSYDDMLATLNAACGYLLNAKIDLETGCTKATAIKTIEGGLAMVRAAIAKATGAA